ncbi:PEP-CTERM sorting domain-containing protein [Horticoccus luteus]|uniref:PEP-CTERM sorting domain-containing protein n=1 Tax=Horticoccus luteus TaxID=2862869 RepID=A0A8F9TVC4_9BACT|nr:PEP-CTERM sorting domain-containing protein [Horticoccus luteus]QYM78973.1 PEP-CTERM sorting domain-containing protein [Horticoccus luteus]
MKSPRPRLFFALVMSAVGATAQTVTILDETFASGARTTLAPPNSAEWFSSGGGSSVTYTADTSITLATGSSGRHLLGYFTADGSPVSLGIGDTMTVTFKIQFDRTTALADGSNNFRIGLFDSTAGTRITADSAGGTSVGALFDNYTGYIATLNSGGSGSNGLRLYERTSTTNQAFIAGIAAYTQLGSSASPNQALATGTTYTGEMSFSRTGSAELTTSFLLTGGSLTNYTISAVDTSPSFSFDTFAIYATSSTTDSMTLSQVKIQYTAVPEPATTAAIFGVLGVAFALWRRRRAA